MGSKNVTCFATLLQNEFHRYVSRFTKQTSPATNQVAARCERLFQKVESSYTFCNKLCTCCAFYRPKTNLFCKEWRNSRAWRDSRVRLSNQKSEFTQLANQVWTWVVKGVTKLFNSFCGNVAKKVARFCRSFYRGLKIYASAWLIRGWCSGWRCCNDTAMSAICFQSL